MLQANQIIIFVDDLSCTALQDKLAFYSLSQHEWRRSQDFIHYKHGRLYTLAHQYLRYKLSQVLSIDPYSLHLDSKPFGKPFIPAILNPHAIEFSFSHSENLVALAVALANPLGIDIEKIVVNKNEDHLTQLAAHCFSLDEQAAFIRLAPAVRTISFYRLWTRKEAYIKALGMGLHKGLKSFSVGLNVDTPVRVEECANESYWVMTVPDMERYGYACAVAYENSIDGIDVISETDVRT